MSDRRALLIVGLMDAAAIYVGVWHFWGWWGVLLAVGLYGKLTVLVRPTVFAVKGAPK